MLILLLVVALIFFAVIAPLKTTAIFAALILLILFTVKISTKIVTGNNVSLSEAFKAVGLSIFRLHCCLYNNKL
ncbi:hypothetical protein [Ectopseudomonas khazarica]|uniref:hypothetical protein n=1 Tax=Ectopseudomonas khazarica TaxID=2502979 RepID=UPI0037CC5182